jgi:hypothetical protein
MKNKKIKVAWIKTNLILWENKDYLVRKVNLEMVFQHLGLQEQKVSQNKINKLYQG